VLLYTIVGMVAGANSYRQMHEFIRVHRQRLNEALGLEGCVATLDAEHCQKNSSGA